MIRVIADETTKGLEKKLAEIGFKYGTLKITCNSVESSPSGMVFIATFRQK